MAENKLKEMMIDDINEDAYEEVKTENMVKLRWYMIQADGRFCKIWDLIVTVATIVSLTFTPFILCFSNVYYYCPGSYDIPNQQVVQTCDDDQKLHNSSLRTIEFFVDIIWLFEILFNFVKITKISIDVETVSKKYVFNGSFIFDFVATIIPLFSGE
jgi:hypothetical protein